ncbi:MAG: hypothetical protein AAGK66_07335 [Pseudomonadota bacterium]
MTCASTTTLNRIRDAEPCQDGWQKLLKHLGKTAADDEPLQLLTVLDSNGLDDALWVLSYAMPDDRLARHFQAWCAEQVLPIFERHRPDDTRVRAQINMLRNDGATSEERDAARAAARAAARDAAWADAGHAAAWADAGHAAARAAARHAALVAARAAAQADAQADAGHAAWTAAWDAAWDAQEKKLRKMLELGQ